VNYTVEQANAMLADLRLRVARIRAARVKMIERAEKIEERVSTDGGGIADSAWFELTAELKKDLEELAQMELILRDPDQGLVDFPTVIEGQEAFLCWRTEEAEVGFWHPTDTGFSGRRPL
jgi:hypothetical protein